MNKVLQGSILAAGMGCAALAHAAAYKCTDDAGHTVYSDIPCAKKAPPPPPPAAAAKPDPAAAAAKPGDPAPVTKITEAGVLHAIDQAAEYITRNNYADLCNMYSTDLKFKMNNQAVKPPKVSQGGRSELCILDRESADQSKRSGMIQQIERGATRVTIEPGETRASATYDSVVQVTHYDQIVSTYHCSAREQWGLYDGKLLYSAMDGTCKP